MIVLNKQKGPSLIFSSCVASYCKSVTFEAAEEREIGTNYTYIDKLPVMSYTVPYKKQDTQKIERRRLRL